MISVIIPVYNTAEYLDECILSVVNQKYTDLEILLIDDCSTDGSAQLLDNWAERDPRITVIHNPVNSGVSASRNIGLQEAKGDFIAFVDSDDWLESNFYFELLNQIEQTGADVVLGGYNRIMVNDVASRVPQAPSGTVFSPEGALLHCMPQRGEGRYDCFIWDKLYRKTAILRDEKLILFDPHYSYGEDVLWLVQVLLNVKTIACWQGCGYNYRSARPGNTWSALSKYKSLEKSKLALETNQKVYQLLAPFQGALENNAKQRILFYQRYVFRTAAKLKDYRTYRQYHKDYLFQLTNWYLKNKTETGRTWYIEQIRDDYRFLKTLCKNQIKTLLHYDGRKKHNPETQEHE